MFLYFIPNAKPDLTAAAARLAGVHVERAITCRAAQSGPGGSAGQIVVEEGAPSPEQIGYFADRQTWRKLSNLKSQISNPPAWVGHATAAPPTPESLARRDALGGHWVTLADGHRWLVPIARGWRDEDGEQRWYHNVPVLLDLDDAGQWTRQSVAAAYASFWDLALRWEEARSQAVLAAAGEIAAHQVTVRFEFSDIIDAAVQVLAVNYRLGRTEAAMLHVFTPETAIEVLDACVDFPTRLAWQQKKTAALAPSAAGTSSSAGPAAATAATAPA